MTRSLALALTALAGCYLSHPPPDAFEDPPLDPPVDCGGGVLAEPEVCGDGLDQDCDGIDPPCPADVCPLGAATRSIARELHFPDPGGCPWGQGDNGGTRGGVYRARTDQSVEVALPPGTVPCALRVEAADQEVVFDDALLVTFADAVVIGSLRPEGIFEMTDGVPRYRWPDLRGRGLEENQGTFCLGDDACALPGSEQRGRFALDVSGETAWALGAVAIAEGSSAVTVVTTGDDNRDSDCRHTPFTLRVTVEVAAETP